MKLFKYFCLLSFMASCSSEQTPQELLSVDLRSGMDHPSMLALQDEIESVEYIPLETTADPASLLDGVSEYAVTSNYIYVLLLRNSVSCSSTGRDSLSRH